MKRALVIVALLSLLAATGCSSLPDSRPGTLSERQQKLEVGEVIAFSSVSDDGLGRTSTAICLIDAEPDAVWDLLTDYSRYYQFFPRAKASALIVRTDYDVRAFAEFHQFPIIGYPAWVYMKMEEEQGDDAFVVRWDRVDGPIPVLHGSWRIERYGEAKTKLTFHNTLKLDYDVPGWIWTLVERVLLPQVVKDVRSEIED